MVFFLGAKVVELADTSDLGSDAARPGGSSPPFRNLICRGLFFLPGRRLLKIEQEKSGVWKIRVWVLPLLILTCSFCSVRTKPEHVQVLRRQIVELAKNLVGIPYRFGGVDIDGFDCSGLVFYIYDCFGIKLSRSAREQARMNGAIKLKHAAPGDILVFKLRKIWHSAIFMDNKRFIHAPNTGGWVRFENLNEYWLSHLHKVITVWPSAR